MAPQGSGVPAPPAASSDASEDATISSQAAYDDLRRLVPPLAAELDHLRASLHEHNLWLLRYGNSSDTPADPFALPPPPPPNANEASDPESAVASANTNTNTNTTSSELPAYSASDVPPYAGGTREEVAQRRDQLTEWLKEGEDVLRDYSARYAQLARELQMPAEDLLGTWQEAAPDNALPDYEMIERREELMVGGVGEVPPPYVRGASPGT